MYYLIALLPDRIQAESAYFALETDNLPMSQIAILGRGYKSIDEYGLRDPKEQAGKQAKWMSFWLVPFGFVSGVTFSVLTDLHTFAWAGEIGNHILGGFLGAGAGAMGSVFAGGGIGLLISDTVSYRQSLNAGKYLVVVKGSELLTQRATPILRKFNPENLQSYPELGTY